MSEVDIKVRRLATPRQKKLLRPTEIMDVRMMAGSEPDTLEIWEDCIRESLCIVTARDTRKALVGIGFVTGNRRHSQLVDLTVHRDYQEQGIGAKIGQQMLDFTLERDTRYIGLTYDTEKPWLKDWYEKAGFMVINFAMWYKGSVPPEFAIPATMEQ